MGRFLSGAGGSVPRSLRQVFEASNPSFAIPGWARFMRVTGVGGGGSGAIGVTTGQRGSGGASGFHVIELPLIIPAGVAAMAVAIGAPGAAVSAAAAAAGNSGGRTTLTLGSVLAMRIDGGPPGQANGNNPMLPNNVGVVINPAVDVGGALSDSGFALWGGQNGTTKHFNGSQALNGLNADGGFGAGGSSLYGRGGAGVAAAPSVNTPGENAVGYGAGGAGALWLAGGAVSSGAGTPGILICEFLEALT